MSQVKLWPSSSGETHARPDRDVRQEAYGLHLVLVDAIQELQRTIPAEAQRPASTATASAAVNPNYTPLFTPRTYRAPIEPVPAAAKDFPEQGAPQSYTYASDKPLSNQAPEAKLTSPTTPESPDLQAAGLNAAELQAYIDSISLRASDIKPEDFGEAA